MAEKFTYHGCRDIFFAIFFIFHIIGLGGFQFYAIVARNDSTSFNGETGNDLLSSNNSDHETVNITNVLIIFLICVGSALFLSFLVLTLFRSFPTAMIHLSFIAPVIIYFIIAGVSVVLYLGNNNPTFIGSAISIGIMFLVNLIIYLVFRSRIPFASTLLEVSSHIATSYPATIAMPYFSVLAQLLYICLVGSTAVSLVNVPHDTIRNIGWLYTTFSLFWFSEVAKNVVHVTICGVSASWYYLLGTPNMPSSPTLGSFKRAMTTSFGSICYGSLLVAIIKLLKALASKKNAFLRCILSIVERLMKYFNTYAFAQVAIYGKSYCEAAKSTWELIEHSGIQAVINDSIISTTLTMASLFCAVVNVFIAIILSVVFQVHITFAIILSIVAFFMGLYFAFMTTQVIDSNVICLFVCFAEDSHVLQQRFPELYHKLQERYSLWGV